MAIFTGMINGVPQYTESSSAASIIRNQAQNKNKTTINAGVGASASKIKSQGGTPTSVVTYDVTSRNDDDDGYSGGGGGSTYVAPQVSVPTYEQYKSTVDNAYDAQKSAADAYMANVKKYADETYDDNQRKSYSGLRAIERALSRRNTPFTGSQLWTVGQAYNNYNNALSGFNKTRQQAIDTGNVNYLSQLATAEGNKTDRYLKLLSAYNNA